MTKPLQNIRKVLEEDFNQGLSITFLLANYCQQIDEIITATYQQYLSDFQSAAVVAIGGYGRCELFPYSDIDLLIITEHDSKNQEALSRFIRHLWDFGLEIKSNVVTLQQAQQQAQHDLSFFTALIEARFLCGAEIYCQQLQQTQWPKPKFIAEKIAEQKQRHAKFDNTGFNLEPDIKKGPGGLRDIHTIFWLYGYALDIGNAQQLAKQKIISDAELKQFLEARNFLWQTRFCLHLIAKRGEDKLLFDYTPRLAKYFGFNEENNNLAVEKFMKKYFRACWTIQNFNSILTSEIYEKFCHDEQQKKAIIDDDFYTLNQLLCCENQHLFLQQPEKIFAAFLLAAKDDRIVGLHPKTIRLLFQANHLIDEEFRQNETNKLNFIRLLKTLNTETLRQLYRCHILSRYLPLFGQIIGQMQFDLYHAYTVDQHILMVLEKVSQIYKTESLGFAHEVFKNIAKPELVYIAALFHDLAKGRGGDHSELGAKDVEAFCLDHDLNAEDTATIIWLVRQHLLMSTTAQRMDIHDPEVIQDFAEKVQSQNRLSCLYILTIADIQGTNKTLWNDWKDALLKRLFEATKIALPRYMVNPMDKDEIIAHVQQQAMKQLLKQNYRREQIESLWQQFGYDYFLRYSVSDIVWQTALISSHHSDEPLVEIKNHRFGSASNIFIYVKGKDGLFAQCATLLDQQNLNIIDAKIITSIHDYSLNTFVVLNPKKQPLNDELTIHKVKIYLQKHLAENQIHLSHKKKLLPRLLKYFSIEPKITFTPSRHQQFTVVELICSDYPGLLSRVGNAFVQCKVRVHKAKIMTLEKRVEDIFFVSDHQNQLLTAEHEQQLKTAILNAIKLDEN